MKRFESLCNEYRENKRLIEELQAMNDSIKLDILAIMGNDETHVEPFRFKRIQERIPGIIHGIQPGNKL